MQNGQELRKPIPDFPRYDITNFGRVFNRDTGREMVLSHNQAGIITVSLMKDEDGLIDGLVSNRFNQRTRSVKSLVAKAFVPGETERFNTPIQLDGDRSNLHASNIVWRPRWFAIRYTRQMYNVEDWFYNGPIVDITNNVEYENYFEAAVANGLLCKDIRLCTLNHKPVFPTGQQFRFVDER